MPSVKDFYVISYDIVCDRRRAKVAKLLEGYGQRVQHSVFEVRLTPIQRARLGVKLEKAIRPDEDSLRWYLLCERCERGMGHAGVGPEAYRIEPVQVL